MSSNRRNRPRGHDVGAKEGFPRPLPSPVSGSVRTAHRFHVDSMPPRMTADRIVKLRVESLRISQKLFADLLNVSLHTVHAWEQGHREPSGCALRLLCLAESNPGRLAALIEEDV